MKIRLRKAIKDKGDVPFKIKIKLFTFNKLFVL
jgi:hypothetical protein